MTNPGRDDWNHFWTRPQTRRFTRISWSKKRIIATLAPHLEGRRRVLDAGCGSGFFSHFFCEEGMEVTALDYSQQALDITGRRTANRVKLLRADLVEGRLDSLLDGKMDLIFTDGLFEHFEREDQDRMIRNFISVLRPEGLVVTVVPNRWSPWELIRPLFMPGIAEKPFVWGELLNLHKRNGMEVVAAGGINVLPFRFSPDRWLGRRCGMLLYCVAKPLADKEI